MLCVRYAPKCLRHSAGFTLIELMVSLAVVSSVALFSVPFFQQTISKLQAISLSSSFKSHIDFARNAAVSRNYCVSICPSQVMSNDSPRCDYSGDWSDGWLVYLDKSCGTGTSGSDINDLDVLKAFNQSNSLLQIREISDRKIVTFNALGNLALSQNRQFEFTYTPSDALSARYFNTLCVNQYSGSFEVQRGSNC